MKTVLISILFFITSCKSQNLNLSFFNDSQKEILKTILKQNDSNIIEFSKLPINEAYYKHIKELRLSIYASDILNNKFLKDVVLCESLENSSIFILKKVKIYNPKGESLKYDLNLESKYLFFLKHLSKNNKVILDYYNSIISTGTLSPVSTAIILHYLTKEDLKNENIRLIIGIHFLLINNSEFQNEIIN